MNLKSTFTWFFTTKMDDFCVFSLILYTYLWDWDSHDIFPGNDFHACNSKTCNVLVCPKLLEVKITSLNFFGILLLMSICCWLIEPHQCDRQGQLGEEELRTGTIHQWPLRVCFTSLVLLCSSSADVDECVTNTHSCQPSERCVNTVSSFVCELQVTCPQGYQLRNSVCEGEFIVLHVLLSQFTQQPIPEPLK